MTQVIGVCCSWYLTLVTRESSRVVIYQLISTEETAATGQATQLEDTGCPFHSVQRSIACLDKEFISHSHDSHCYILVYQPMENDGFSVIYSDNAVSIMEDDLLTFKVSIRMRKSGDLSDRRQNIQWRGKYLVGVRGRRRMARLVGDHRKAAGTRITTNDTRGMKNNTSEHTTSSTLKSCAYTQYTAVKWTSVWTQSSGENERVYSLNSCCNCFQHQSAFLKCRVN